ncbi:MAG: poly-gamma-glutamate biosynthesis protein PgsC [Myxococcales bacterium]|nr:poly-gamma-glutamate biosynthesis protein PgsC [Myxococcales bacterium]MCB9649792.1 poly-gamma-glutamate biosynthesis protein PgsC [Deltaproteobacteria bacterium]
MIEPLAAAIGVGLVISLLFSELFGLAAGGMVVPGYFAVGLSQPMDLALTLATAFITFAFVHALASVVIVYGRRRTVLMILVGYIVGALMRSMASDLETASGGDYTVIGYIIPGLIAIWMERQGIVETISALLTAAVVIRLVLILVGVEVPA